MDVEQRFLSRLARSLVIIQAELRRHLSDLLLELKSLQLLRMCIILWASNFIFILIFDVWKIYSLCEAD